MVTIHAIDRDGSSHVFTTPPTGSLMQALKDEGLDIPAICGGSCSCATCHIFVDPSWMQVVGSATGIEAELLADNAEYEADRSRLSCQVQLTSALDGLQITVAPIDG